MKITEEHPMGTIDFLVDEGIADGLAEDLVEAYRKYNVRIATSDPDVVNRWFIYKLKLLKNTRASMVRARAPDVQLRLGVKQLEVIEGAQALYIAILKYDITYDHLPEILREHYTELGELKLPYPVGFKFDSIPIMIDLSESPHTLMGGATGSGKSVSLQTFISTVACIKSPDEVNMALIDTGANDLMYFEGLPHLSCPIIQSQGEAIRALTAVAAEMTRRVGLEHTSPDEYASLPSIVVVIDEYPALFSGLDSKEKKFLSDTISALLQRGRHAKIYLVLSSQNPTAHQMRAEIGNITTRIAFRCAKKNYSEIILGEAGAENLSGKGELLLKASHFDGTERLQGVYATPDELRAIVLWSKNRYHYGSYKEGIKFTIPSELLNPADQIDTADICSIPPVIGKASAEDRMLARIIQWALSQDCISVNKVMAQFHLGWNKASRLVAKLEELGIVDKLDAKLPRQVAPTKIDDLPSEMLDFLQRNGIASESVCQALAARDSAPYSKP